jgi:short-subunit dehydrogenase
MGKFHEISSQSVKDEINVNVLPISLLTHELLPKMLKRELRSAIINLSSVAGENPIPHISGYSASKAYGDFLSQALELEYSQKIDILSVRPMYVESNMSHM